MRKKSHIGDVMKSQTVNIVLINLNRYIDRVGFSDIPRRRNRTFITFNSPVSFHVIFNSLVSFHAVNFSNCGKCKKILSHGMREYSLSLVSIASLLFPTWKCLCKTNVLSHISLAISTFDIPTPPLQGKPARVGDGRWWRRPLS